MTRIASRRNRGFTLFELIIVLFIGSLIISIGATAFQSIVYNSKRLSTFQGLYVSLKAARLEAIQRTNHVTVCKANQARSGCDTDSTTPWTNGWLIFVDADASGTYEAEDDTLLRVFDEVEAGIHVEGNSKVTKRITFSLMGRTGQNGTITICDPRGVDHARAIVIATSGRIRSKRDGLNAAYCS